MKKITDTRILQKYIDDYQLDKVIGRDALDQGHIAIYQKGESVVNSGEVLEHFCFFLRGKLKILSSLENGKTLLLNFYTELDTLGDIELFYPDPVDCGVEVIAESYVYRIPMHIIKDNYMADAIFLSYIGRSLSDKLRRLSRNSAYNLYYPLINRLSSYIFEHTEGHQVVFYSSYAEIAEFLGTTYRHLNRTLNDLADMKIIRLEGKKITVLDLNALKALAKNLYR